MLLEPFSDFSNFGFLPCIKLIIASILDMCTEFSADVGPPALFEVPTLICALETIGQVAY